MSALNPLDVETGDGSVQHAELVNASESQEKMCKGATFNYLSKMIGICHPASAEELLRFVNAAAADVIRENLSTFTEMINREMERSEA